MSGCASCMNAWKLSASAHSMRSGLFAQPGGFERLIWVGEALATHDLAGVECVELRVPLVHREPALASPPFSHQDDHLVASPIDDPLDLDSPVVPGLRPPLDVGEDRRVADAELP